MMKKRAHVRLSTITKYGQIERPNQAIVGGLAKQSMELLGYNHREYKVTTIPTWLEEQQKLLRKLGVPKAIISRVRFYDALNSLLEKYPEDVLCIEWSETASKKWYLLAFKKSFEVSGIWSKI